MKVLRNFAMVLAVPIVLAACASEVSTVMSRVVIVRAGFPDGGVEKARVLAEAECRKQGLSARVQTVDSPRYVFECVQAGS